MEDEAHYFGRIAYEAYCETTEWKSAVTGAPLPQFDDQKEPIQLAWINAARAVRVAHDSKRFL